MPRRLACGCLLRYLPVPAMNHCPCLRAFFIPVACHAATTNIAFCYLLLYATTLPVPRPYPFETYRRATARCVTCYSIVIPPPSPQPSNLYITCLYHYTQLPLYPTCRHYNLVHWVFSGIIPRFLICTTYAGFPHIVLLTVKHAIYLSPYHIVPAACNCTRPVFPFLLSP